MEFQNAPVYSLNKSAKIHVAGIYIAIGFVELGLYANRPIEQNEEYWFSGGTTLAREFDSDKWHDILKLYLEICSMVKERNFFREK